MPTQVYISMTVSHLSESVPSFGKNLRNTNVLFHIFLLRLNYDHQFLKEKNISLREAQFLLQYHYWVLKLILKTVIFVSVVTVVAQWLRGCATNRKVAGSIPDGVTRIAHWHNPSDRTVALGSTQPLTEMIARNISWEWNRPYHHSGPLSHNLTTLTSWNPLGASGL